MGPNDLKLSDGGAWRGSCEAGAQKEASDVGQSHDRTGRVQARIAATVTRGAVRCSAWLGDVDWRSLRIARVVDVVGVWKASVDCEQEITEQNYIGNQLILSAYISVVEMVDGVTAALNAA